MKAPMYDLGSIHMLSVCAAAILCLTVPRWDQNGLLLLLLAVPQVFTDSIDAGHEDEGARDV